MPSIAIARFTDEIIAIYMAKDRARSTIDQVKLVLRELAECGARRTGDFTVATIAGWRNAHPGRSASTTKAYLRVMSALCSYAKFQGYLRRDPFDLYGVNEWVRDDARPKVPRRQYHRSPEEIRNVLALATEEAGGGDWMACRLEAYVYTLFLLGARPGEVQHILSPNVDHGACTITIEPVEVPVGKGLRWWRPKTVGSSTTLPAGPALLAVLKKWERRRLINGFRVSTCPFLFPGAKLRGPWTSGGPGVSPLDHVRALGERAGIKDLVNKSARKSVGTHAKTMGLGGLERKALFRHSDVRTGDYYDEDRVESLRPAVAKVEGFYLGTGS